MDEKTILIDALAIASLEDRADFLSRECSDDPALRRRIDALIEANQQTEQMLDSPLFEAGQTDHGVEIDLSFLEACDRPDTLGRIGTYEVVDVLGRGATGIVLKAHDPKLNRFVAVKVLIPQIATNATARKRFLREARATAAVSHPHVITIHAVEEHHQIPYLVMECIVGKTLQEKIDNEGTLEIEAVLRIGIQIAEGLAAAHAQGLIHRDIKPANILLENGVERVSITDFGLARAADDATLTKSGCVSGTPPYMSPEQTQAQPLDSRSDLFSLGSVMYAMCTGHSPFRADSTIGAIRRVCDETPRPVYELNPKVPRWLADIIEKLLAKIRDDRFQSATEVADLLGQRLRSFQDPTQFDQPETLDSPTKQPHAATRKTSSSSRRVLVTVMFALVVGLGIAEITGVTRLREVLLGPAVVEHSKPIAGSPVVNPDEPPSKNNPLAKVVSPPEPTPTEILTSDKWKWTEPVKLGPKINTDADEGGPELSADGLTLLFHSNRPGSQPNVPGPNGVPSVDLWMSSRESTDDPFGEPVNLGPTINGNVFDHDPALSADALTLVFSSNRAGGLGTKALWMSTRSSKDDPWSTPVNLGSQINGQDQETGACLSADGLTLLFNSAVSQGGKCSLLRSTRSAKDRPWSKPVTLKSVIVGDDPVAAIWDVTLSGDGLTMISRSRFNLSMSTRSSPGDPWPERRGLRLVASGFKHFASPCLSGDGRILVFEGIGANSVRDLWISHRVPVKSLPSPDASLP